MSKVDITVVKSFVVPGGVFIDIDSKGIGTTVVLSQKQALKLLNDLARVLDGE